MNNEHHILRSALDSIPTLAVRPVDLAVIYRTGHEQQMRSAKRWKRAAIGIAALAAGVFVVALIPKLEVRLSGDEFAVRWGQPTIAVVEIAPAPIPQVDPRLPNLIEDQQLQIAALRTLNLKYAEMQELLLALTTDVVDRDKLQLARLMELTRELRAFQLITAKQFDQTEKTSTTLYNAMFTTKLKTGD